MQQTVGSLGVPLICPGQVAPPQPGQSAAGLPVGAPVGIDPSVLLPARPNHGGRAVGSPSREGIGDATIGDRATASAIRSASRATMGFEQPWPGTVALDTERPARHRSTQTATRGL